MSQASGVDSTDLANRLHFMRTNDETTKILRDTWRLIEPALPGILEGFYRHVLTVPALAALIGGMSASLTAAQSAHWKRLFTSGFDAGHVDSVRRIGSAHNRIGLEPRWYIGGYSYVIRELIHVIVRHNRWSRSKASSAIAAASGQASSNVQTIASAQEELSSSIVEIDRQVGKSTQITTIGAAVGTQEVSSTIVEVTSGTREVSESGSGAAASATVVTERTDRLRADIEAFFERIRAA